MSPIAPIVDGRVVAEALQAHLKNWLPMWLAEIDRERGFNPGFTSEPKSWQIVQQLDFSEEPQYPAIIIVLNGITNQPMREGNGNLRATWPVDVAIAVSGPDADTTDKLAKRYEAAILAAIETKRSLGDPNVRGTDLTATSYTETPPEQRRTRSIVYMRFNIEYDHVARTNEVNLPSDPPVDPTTPLPDYPTLPDIDHVYVDVTKEA